ncbi:MAG TPA: L-arabinonate dehydratase, partial [Xanthomonadales bacterium]|nr:L-arabinonate dehydratase [Xanthomonadales bacterium]
MAEKKTLKELRSRRWFGDDLRSFGHRARMMQMGYSYEDWQDRPIIGIINTWSDLNACHQHLKDRADDVRQGVVAAGGLPVELPANSVSETFVKPTSMLYRNLLAMEAEEYIRSQPIDGAVLMGGCDKTTPGLVMGAISAGVPFIYVPAGAALRGHSGGKVLGSGSDAWKYWDELRAGTISEAEWSDIEAGICRSYGTCMTMGTASTMTAIAETLGLSLTGASSIPAPDSGHKRMARQSGRRIVDMVWEDLTADKILSRQAFENAIAAAMAMGCSSNAIIHVIAMAGRAGVDIKLDDFESASRKVAVIANIRPNGDTYLMEDFFYAGGLPAMLNVMKDQLHLDCQTVTGKSLGENIASSRVHNADVIRAIDAPICESSALAVLRGNLSPDGCVMKISAMDSRFLRHSGPALVFDDYAEMKAAMINPDLDVTADTVLVLRNAGPKGGPGMPEWGMLPIPDKLLKQGVRDMLRLSDARMSGTSYGACILHVAPEAYVGGPLALVETGDMINVNVPERTLSWDVSEEEFARRKGRWVKPEP